MGARSIEKTAIADRARKVEEGMGLTLWSAAKKVAATIQAIGDRLQTSKSTTGLLDTAKAFSGSLKDQSK